MPFDVSLNLSVPASALTGRMGSDTFQGSSELAVNGFDVQEAGIKGLIGAGHFGDPRRIFNVVGMGRVGQGVQNLLEPGHASGIFQGSAPGAVEQPRRRRSLRRRAAGNQLEPVKPAVAEVVLIERDPGSSRQQLIQRAILLCPVLRFFARPPGEPLQGFRYLAIDRPQRREGIAAGKSVQMSIQPKATCRTPCT